MHNCPVIEKALEILEQWGKETFRDDQKETFGGSAWAGGEMQGLCQARKLLRDLTQQEAPYTEPEREF